MTYFQRLLPFAERAVAQAVTELNLGHYKRLPRAKREAVEDRALELLAQWKADAEDELWRLTGESNEEATSGDGVDGRR